MKYSSSKQTPTSSCSAFQTTRWTLVLQAQGDTPEASAALSELCEAYWTPVFRFLRREGRNENEARDLSQEFFARLLEKGKIGKADPEKGHFRSYLLGALKHFLSDVRRGKNRQKRGGDALIESVDDHDDAGTQLQLSDPAGSIPDSYFDHQWALAVMDHALGVVQSDFTAAGKGNLFEGLKPWLVGDCENLSQADVATRLGMTTNALKVAIHRMRANFRRAVTSEISQTVDGSAEVDEELRYLIEVLS